MTTREKWESVCDSLRISSGPKLESAIASLKIEISSWPAALRHLDDKHPWLEGIFEGNFDPRLELVGHAAIRSTGTAPYGNFAIGGMLKIIRMFAHHLDASFDPPDAVLEDVNDIRSAYGCGGGTAWKKVGSPEQWCQFHSSATESPSMGMRSDDSWSVHGLSAGNSVSIAVSEFTDDFEFTASGNTPAIFELATVWTEVKFGANSEKVEQLLAAAQRGRTTPRT